MFRRLCPLLFLVCATLSCARNGTKEQGLSLTPCRIEGVARQVTCGKLEVFEDRAAATGRKISLRVVVIPALASNPEPDPLFILAGGPGQAATELGRHLLSEFERVARTRDLVLVDQRGTGSSNPLDCEPVADDAPLRDHFDERFPEAEYRACLKKYDADARFYTTPLAMDDLDDVRRALGYEKINLRGSSYGTRAALVYLRQHEDRVRSVILDGVAPMSLLLPLYIPRDTQRAMEKLFAECEQTTTCAKAYPGLRARFEAHLLKLEAEPVQVTVDHPLTGKPDSFTISRDMFTGALRGLLYLPEASALVPYVLDSALRGDYRPYVAAGSSLAGSLAKNMSQGMFLSVVCSEDAPFITEEKITKEASKTWLGPGPVRKVLQPCGFWPKGTLPPNYRDAVSSKVPVLLLSGELDPVTPPSWAEEARKTLPNSLHLALPGVGHGTSAFGCVRTLMSSFIDRASVEGLDGSCGQKFLRPPFVTSFAGPEP